MWNKHLITKNEIIIETTYTQHMCNKKYLFVVKLFTHCSFLHINWPNSSNDPGNRRQLLIQLCCSGNQNSEYVLYYLIAVDLLMFTF